MSGSVPAGDCGRFRVQFLQCRIRLDTNQNLPQPRGSHRICVSLQDTTTVPATALLPICRFGRAARALMWPSQPKWHALCVPCLPKSGECCGVEIRSLYGNGLVILSTRLMLRISPHTA